MTNILVTGGAGFIGSNFIRMVLSEYADYTVINLDKLTYSGNLGNLAGFMDMANHKFIKGDICDAELVSRLIADYDIDVIVNFAAESHVDRSIIDPDVFIETNVTGTLILLKAALDNKIEKFIGMLVNLQDRIFFITRFYQTGYWEIFFCQVDLNIMRKPHAKHIVLTFGPAFQ